MLRNVAGILLAVSRRSEISPRFVAACLFSYLDGEVQTLDKAFGLSKRGAPTRDRERNIAIAVKVLRFERAKQRGSVKAFFLSLAETYEKVGIKSKSSFLRIAQAYRREAEWTLMAQETSRRRRRAVKRARPRGA